MSRCRLFAALCGTVLVASCNQSGFAGAGVGTDANPPPSSGTDDDEAPQATDLETQRTSSNKRPAKADVLWVISNQDGMVSTSDQLGRYLGPFMDTLIGDLDLRIGMLSDNKPGEGHWERLKAPAELPPALESRLTARVPIVVNSTNALLMAAVAACEPETTDMRLENDFAISSTSRICGSSLPDLADGHTTESLPSQSPANVIAAIGTLATFFRADAEPTIIVVSNDDSLGVVAENFRRFWPTAWRNRLKVHVFRGLSRDADCYVGNVGAEYGKIAAQTGGNSYDLCAPDWGPSFEDLADEIRDGSTASVPAD